MNEKKKILLVDDEPGITKIVGKRLESEGYDVVIAVDGEEALRQAAAVRPDLVILDVMLPKLNGFDVCRRLKDDGGVPVILFTAMAQERDMKRGFESGADAYVRKPFRTKELLGKIRELIDGKEG